MLTVICVFFSFLVVAFASMYLPRKDGMYFQALSCCLILGVFFCCRDLPVLNDTAHYYEHLYHLISKASFDGRSIFEVNPRERFEYGFCVWENFIAKYIWKDAYSIVFITALINTLFYVWYIKKYMA